MELLAFEKYVAVFILVLGKLGIYPHSPFSKL